MRPGRLMARQFLTFGNEPSLVVLARLKRAVRRAIARRRLGPRTAPSSARRRMVCEFCESEIPIGFSLCPACGKPQSAPGQADRRALWFVLIVAVTFGIAVAEHHLVFSP